MSRDFAESIDVSHAVLGNRTFSDVKIQCPDTKDLCVCRVPGHFPMYYDTRRRHDNCSFFKKRKQRLLGYSGWGVAEWTTYAHSVVLEQMQTEHSNVTKPLPKSKEQNLHFYTRLFLHGRWRKARCKQLCGGSRVGTTPGECTGSRADAQQTTTEMYRLLQMENSGNTQYKMETQKGRCSSRSSANGRLQGSPLYPSPWLWRG